MTPIISIEFTARRYHATPWGTHVNEGHVEWPPCPWRLLRALIAVGYNKLGWIDGPTGAARSVIEKLTCCLPSYSLPLNWTETHTRHYMPVRDGKAEKNAKVFDAYLRMGGFSDRLFVRYDTSLEASEVAELSRMAEGLNYLGRAESWVDAKLVVATDFDRPNSDLSWIGPCDSDHFDRVRLLAPLGSRQYDHWRSETAAIAEARSESETIIAAESKGKKATPAALKKAKLSATVAYPGDQVAAMQTDSATWQAEGWPQPPGSRWVDYPRPHSAQLSTKFSDPIAVPRNVTSQTLVNSVLLSIDGEGLRGTLRPSLSRALPLMELLHSESIRLADKLGLGHLPELTGMNENGGPLRGAHTHAHWIPLCFTKAGSIDHVLIYAPSGFSSNSLQAISCIRWAYAKGIHKLSLNVVGQGAFADLAEQVPHSSMNVFGNGCVFESATPLVLRKFLSRGKKTVEGQIREELRERGFEEPESVEVWSDQQMVSRRLKGFVLCRKLSKQQPPKARSWAATIRFASPPTPQPINLGYASHYGLGLFQSV